MKFFSILLICAAAVAFMPVQGQSSRSSRSKGKAAAAEQAEPTSGVRFVVYAPGTEKFPSKVYVRKGKEYGTISIGARTPSDRVAVSGGEIDFWLENPKPKSLKDDKESKKEKAPKPDFSVSVPGGASKQICILTPGKDLKSTQTIFFNEADFPRKGMHIINLSSYPLQMITSKDADFKDKKTDKIGIYRKKDGISSENSWRFRGEKGEKVSFVLQYADKATKKYRPVKSSVFVVSDRQTVINLVVKDARADRPKLVTIQIPEDKDK